MGRKVDPSTNDWGTHLLGNYCCVSGAHSKILQKQSPNRLSEGLPPIEVSDDESASDSESSVSNDESMSGSESDMSDDEYTADSGCNMSDSTMV